MNDHEGPVTIPTRTIVTKGYTTCFGCKHHSHSLRRSGQNPEYDDSCEHPDAWHDLPDELKGKWSYRSRELPTAFGGEQVTPDWCPVLRAGGEW